jgi:hypothetical protein
MGKLMLLTAAAALGAAGLLAGLGLGASDRSAVRLTAKLSAAQEVPRPKAAARASGTFTATLTGRRLAWRLTFSRLTGPALAAHVHLGARGIAGPVAVPLCAPCTSGTKGTRAVSAKAAAGLARGGAYVNVHTKRNPAGEIRGQVAGGSPAAPPTPTTAPTTTDPYDDGGYG